MTYKSELGEMPTSGALIPYEWPGSYCLAMVEATRAAGVLTGPLGINNIPMTEWGLHLYYNNAILVEKRSLNAAGRPWTDPLNAFAANYEFKKGTLPVLDDLIDRTSLLAIPPVLSAQAVETIGAEFLRAASILEEGRGSATPVEHERR